jgi:tetratricopeptide (TPR) repeat protein
MSRRKEFEERKDVGNHLMKLHQYEQARDIYYSILLDIANESSSLDPESAARYQEIEIACLNNLSSLFYLLKNYDEVINLTSKILEMSLGKDGEKKKVKALYRQSQAYEQLGYVSIAMERISKLLEIEPKNQQAKEYFMKLMNRNSMETPVSTTSPGSPPVRPDSVPIHTEEGKGLIENESKEETLSNPKTQKETPTPPDTSDYGFMNPSWRPQLPSAESSSSATETNFHTQTFETEIEKNKIKNSIFLSALTSLQSSPSSSLPASSSSPSSSSSCHQRKPTGQISTSQQVHDHFHELLKEEEEEFKQIQNKTKVSSSVSSPVPPPPAVPAGPAPLPAAASLRSKKVISTTAHEEWLTLMREEETMKRLVEEKKKTKRVTKKLKDSHREGEWQRLHHHRIQGEN